MPTPLIGDIVKTAIIIAHMEDTTDIENFFNNEGKAFTRQTMTYDQEQLAYPAIVRCFLNHHQAWRNIAAREDDAWVLIVEADFCPVKNLFREKVFWPWFEPNTYGYLYHNSPRFIAFDRSYIRAHSAGAVAYVINRHIAKVFLEFYIDEQRKRDFRRYFTFDVHLPWYCMSVGVKAYISLRQLGEHGGLVSRGHIDAKIPRLGHHRADRLAGPLAFAPIYCIGNRFALFRERVYGYSIGVMRLLSGRWTTDTSEHVWTKKEKLYAYAVAMRRLFF